MSESKNNLEQALAATVLLLGAMLLSGCNSSVQPDLLTVSPEPALTASQAAASPVETSTERASFDSQNPVDATATAFPLTATAQPSADRTKYVLGAILDFPDQSLQVRETVFYLNQTGASLDQLLFVVDANWESGIFSLLDVRASADSLVGWELDRGLLRLHLTEPIQPQGRLQIQIDFSLKLPAQPGKLAFTFRQTNIGDWYPFVPPYDATRGWLAYQPAAVGEYLAYDLADFEVHLELHNPAELELTIAASSWAVEDALGYHYRHDAARNFVLSISPQYDVYEAMVGTVRVVSYVYPEVTDSGQGALNVAVDALSLYSEYFGPYPHQTLSLVQSEFPDGLEYDGLVYIGQEYYWGYGGDLQNLLTFITAHEVAHQWWYGRLANDQATEPWLDEALATYSEVLFYELGHGEDLPLPVTPVADTLAEWWWLFRVEFYDPSEGFVGDSVYQYGSWRPYINAVYLRGVLFLDELRNLMGDQAFLEALAIYAQSNQDRFVDADDFWTAVESTSDVDLGPLQRKYFGP